MQDLKAVFFDRDGVLNKTFVQNGKPFAPRLLEDFEVFQEAINLSQKLKQANYLIVVVTNQPDVGNGFVSRATVDSMHDKLKGLMVLDAIKVCYHRQGLDCSCRKPKPGMLLEAAEEFGLDLSQCYMVGDRDSDIQAGNAAGCKTVFLDFDYAEPKLGVPDFVVRSLSEVTDIILPTIQRKL